MPIRTPSLAQRHFTFSVSFSGSTPRGRRYRQHNKAAGSRADPQSGRRLAIIEDGGGSGGARSSASQAPTGLRSPCQQDAEVSYQGQQLSPMIPFR